MNSGGNCFQENKVFLESVIKLTIKLRNNMECRVERLSSLYGGFSFVKMVEMNLIIQYEA